MASGVELDLLRRVQALEQQVQQLSTTQRDETLQPTYVTINPATGAVGALFTGLINALGVIIPTGSLVNPAAANEIAWERASDNAITAYVGGVENNGQDNLIVAAQATAAANPGQVLIAGYGSGEPYSVLLVSSGTSGSVPVISGLVGTRPFFTLMDGNGRSNFLQIGSAILSTAGTTTIPFPGGTYEASANVFLPGASGTVYGVATATGRSDGGGLVMTALTPLGSGLVTFTVLAANQPANGVTVGVSYIIWGS